METWGQRLESDDRGFRDFFSWGVRMVCKWQWKYKEVGKVWETPKDRAAEEAASSGKYQENTADLLMTHYYVLSAWKPFRSWWDASTKWCLPKLSMTKPAFKCAKRPQNHLGLLFSSSSCSEEEEPWKIRSLNVHSCKPSEGSWQFRIQLWHITFLFYLLVLFILGSKCKTEVWGSGSD